MKAKPPKDRKERRSPVRNYVPQPEDFYGLYKLYEFRDMQAANPALWDEMLAHLEARGDVKADKFDVPERAAKKHLRTYREKSSTVADVLGLRYSSLRKGWSLKDIAEELSLEESYVESITLSYKILPEDPYEVIPHFPIEFVMWCPPGETVQIYWKHNPARTLSQKRSQNSYIKKLKDEMFPSVEILQLYKMGWRYDSERLTQSLYAALAKGEFAIFVKAFGDDWTVLFRHSLCVVEILLLADKGFKNSLTEIEDARLETLVNYVLGALGVTISYSEPEIVNFNPFERSECNEEMLRMLMEEARLQRVCHLMNIEVKHLKPPKSIAAAMG